MSRLYPRHINQFGNPTSKPLALYDKWLIFAIIGLVILGIMMVTSSSVMISSKNYHQPFHYLYRQASYLALGVLVSIFIIRTESDFWQRVSVPVLFGCIFLLTIVLIPGIGKVVNGSRRWLAVGPIGIQVSELAKASMIFYLSGYLVRQKADIQASLSGFLKPLLILIVFAILLLLEPDFGATVVISGTVMAMLFLTGARLRYYFGLLLVVGLAFFLLAISSPYRLTRLTTFLNPWADQFNAGYQLTQSLIAFGRGGWFGVGLGDSVQKLFYLPEAHTDFLFAVLAEELGLVGVLSVIAFYCILVFRGLCIGAVAYQQQRLFASYMSYGITIWLGLQATINMGVNAGLLPTKGLTLPLMSYGGASMLVCLSVLAILVRIDHENRWNALGLGSNSC